MIPQSYDPHLLESDVSSQQSVDSLSLLSATASFSRTDSQPRSLLDKTRKCQSVSSFFAREKQAQFSYASVRLAEGISHFQNILNLYILTTVIFIYPFR